MKGDFTRTTFDQTKHYSRVLEQQGRVQLDSDFNEMNDIHRYLSRRLAADLIGPHGGRGDGFKIQVARENNKEVLRDFELTEGRYYVDGVLCEIDETVLYSRQLGFPLGRDVLDKEAQYLAYLDVWERHVTAYEDEDEEHAGIREVALRGPDTATRAQVVWQVKLRAVDQAVITKLSEADPLAVYVSFRNFLGEAITSTGQLRARALKPKGDDEPCLISPESRYRGAENQLYRVEIHQGGVAIPRDTDLAKVDRTKIATFKWSRENGSVIFPITDLQGDVVTLRDLGRETRFGLQLDDWVEVVDSDYVLQNRANQLLQVKKIDRDSMQVTLNAAPATGLGTNQKKHPLLRRWDQSSDAIMVVETTGDDDKDWTFTLENGVQIQFPGKAQPGGAAPAPATYRTGDYWLIPARVATGDVEWPGPPGNPRSRPPAGVEHGYAPLGIISLASGGNITLAKDLRRTIKQLWL